MLLRREGWRVNHKRVYRLYRLEGLGLRLEPRRKRVSPGRVVPPSAMQPNERWSMDVMTDQVQDSRRFRVLTLVDTVRRASPALAVGQSLTGKRVVAMLDHVKRTHGLPQRIAVDNGPEFISLVLDAWAHRNRVQLEFSRPGAPTDNAYIEAFNGRLRDECLNQHWFASINQARQTIEQWRHEYNTERPHGALGNLTPPAFAVQWTAAQAGVYVSPYHTEWRALGVDGSPFPNLLTSSESGSSSARPAHQSIATARPVRPTIAPIGSPRSGVK